MTPTRDSTLSLTSVAAALAAALLAAPGPAQCIGCGGWQLVPSPSPASPISLLYAVSAGSPTSVWALGEGQGGGADFVLKHDGTAWGQVALPYATSFGAQWLWPTAIEAFASGEAWLAGGIHFSAFDSRILLMRGDGSQWSQIDFLILQPQTVYPYARRSGSPNAMDGVNPDDVWVVGTANSFGTGTGSVTVGMGLHWDGSSWTEHVLPPVHNRVEHVVGVTMVASNDVWAVGYGHNVTPATDRVLIYHWDGSSWTYSPNPMQNADSRLYDIAAVSANDVWAVGGDGWGGGSGPPLFMHWDGIAWSVVPGPVSARTGDVRRITAVASGDVWASDPGNNRVFHWDGTAWSVVTPPGPAGATTYVRSDLDALGPCDIWCVGRADYSSGWVTLTEHLQRCPGVFTAYGAGLAGSGGLVPQLDGEGCPTPGGDICQTVSNGLGGAPGAFAVGWQIGAVPLLGGTLLVGGTPIGILCVLDGTAGVPGAGSAKLTVNVPAHPSWIGLLLYTQVLIVDPAATGGVSFSAGLEVLVQ